MSPERPNKRARDDDSAADIIERGISRASKLQGSGYISEDTLRASTLALKGAHQAITNPWLQHLQNRQETEASGKRSLELCDQEVPASLKRPQWKWELSLDRLAKLK